MFSDLGPWIKRDEVKMDDFAKGMLNAYAYNGKQYGFPLIVSTSVFVYNKTMLDELGVEPPQKWDEIDDFNAKVTKRRRQNDALCLLRSRLGYVVLRSVEH